VANNDQPDEAAAVSGEDVYETAEPDAAADSEASGAEDVPPPDEGR
jgi:hypothetical protein